MPGILRSYDPNDKTINELADNERRQRKEDIDTLWKWRDGDHPDTLLTYPGERNDNIPIPLSGQKVDALSDFIGQPTFTVPGGVDTVRLPDGSYSVEETPEQQALNMLLEESRFDSLHSDIVESGAVSGHVFLRVVITDENDVTISHIDPRFVTVYWDVERIGTRRSTLYYEMMWQAAGKQKRQHIVPAWLVEGTEYAVPADTWLIIEWMRGENDSKWLETGRDVWEYPFAPIVDGKVFRRAHQYYGRSLIDDYHLNNSVNFVASNTGKIIKHHAHPKTVGLDVNVPDSAGVDEFVTVTSTGQQRGEIFNLTIDPNGIRHSMDFLAYLQQVYFTTGRIVDPLSVRDKVGNITNFGLRTLYRDMIGLAEQGRSQIGSVECEALHRALFVAGVDVEKPDITWSDPLPQDIKELVETGEKKVGLGVSKQTIHEELGYDYADEQERVNEESANAQQAVGRQLELFGERNQSLVGGFPS